jgi:hypothetical protein
MMTILQIEHPVRSFEGWKAAFDSDPVARARGGVRRYRIYRPVDDPGYVGLDLEFDDRPTAESFKVALEGLWRSPQAAAALGGAPHCRIVEVVENRAL